MRRIPALLPAAILLLTLAACGDSEPPAPAQPTATSAPATPTAQPSLAGESPAPASRLPYGEPLFPLPLDVIAAGPPEFLGAGQFIPGAGPGFVLVTGDFSPDGRLRLRPIFAAGHPDFVEFDLPGIGPRHPLLADFDQDGISDLAYQVDGAVRLRLAGADGPLSRELSLARQGRPTGLAAGDFDGDGQIDLAASFDPDFSGHRIEFLAGDGQGGLAASGLILTIGGGNPPLAAADLDGDGADDLIAADNEAGLLLVYYGGAEPFQRYDATTLEGRAGAIGVGDVAGEEGFGADGRLDLIVLLPWSEANYALIWPGSADASVAFARPLRLDVPAGLDAVEVQDFNGDGLADLLFLPRFSPGGQQLLLQERTNPEGWRPAALPLSPQANLLALADFNADGWDDLAGLVSVGNATSGVTLLAGSAQGWLGPTRLTGESAIWAVAAADFDGDGREDLAVAHSLVAADQSRPRKPGDDRVTLLLAGDDGFRPAASLPTGHSPLALLAADWNNDGAIDLLSADYGSSQISRFLGDGRGGLAPAEPLPAGQNPIALAGGDLDGDGRFDLLAANAASGEIDIYLGGQELAQSGQVFVGGNPWALALADFDGDGRLDLAMAQANFNLAGKLGQVLLLPGDGQGGFGPPAPAASGPNPAGLAVADFDGDGRPDLAAAFSAAMFDENLRPELSGGGVVVLLNRDGRLEEAWRSSDGGHPHHLTAGDFDGDGIVDLLAGGAGGGSPWLAYRILTLLPGLGGGRFGPALVFGAGGAVRGLAAADMNNDGRLDALLAQPGAGAQLYANSPGLGPVLPAAQPEAPAPLPGQPFGPAPNPPPGYPGLWRPLVEAGWTQLDLPGQARVLKLAFNPAAGLLYALDSAGTIHVLNSVSLRLEDRWPINAQDLLLDDAGRRLFAARREGNETLILDPATGRQQGVIPQAGQLALDTQRNRLFIVAGGVWQADPATGRVLGSLPAAFQLFSSYIYSPGNLSALYDPAGDRLVVRGTLGGPGSSGAVQHSHVYDAATLGRLPQQYNRSYWLPSMAVDRASGEFYATAANLDASTRQISFFDVQGQLLAEIVGAGGWILQGSAPSPLYLADRERIVTVDVASRSVVDFTPLAAEVVAAAGEPRADRLALVDGQGRLAIWVPATESRPRFGPGEAQPGLPAGRTVLDLAVDGQLLIARVAGPAESYGWPRELYRSTDGGAAWQRIDRDLLGAYAGQVVLAPGRGPQSPLWAVAFHGGQPAGVFRAYNTGEFWQLANLGLRHLRVVDLQLAPGTEETLFALSSEQRLYASSDGGGAWRESFAEAAAFLLSPNYAEDATVWLRTSGGLYGVSNDGGASWELADSSPWWDSADPVLFFFSPGWPEQGAAYRIGAGAAAVKQAGRAAWQPFDLPRAKGLFETLTLHFLSDEAFLAFYSDPGSADAAGQLYWTADGGASWRLLLQGQAEEGRLTALAADAGQLAKTGLFWLGNSKGEVTRRRVEDLLPAGRAVTPAPQPAPASTAAAGPRLGDAPPAGLAGPDSRLAAAWEKVSGQLGWAVTSGQEMAAAWQTFERGQMIWLSDAPAGYEGIDGPTILALNDGDGWRIEVDAWQEGEAMPGPALAPPAGLLAPERGFGKVWHSMPDVRERLGWALEREIGQAAFVQPFEHGLMIWLQGRSYALIRTEEDSSWQQAF